jgi:hypothetical protein
MIEYSSSNQASWHGAGLAGRFARGGKTGSWPRRFADFLATQTDMLRGNQALLALPPRRALATARVLAPR